MWPVHGPFQLSRDYKGFFPWNNTLCKCLIWIPATKLAGSASKYLLWVLPNHFISSSFLVILGWPYQYERYKESQNVVTKICIKELSTPFEQTYTCKVHESVIKTSLQRKGKHQMTSLVNSTKHFNKINNNSFLSLPKSVRIKHFLTHSVSSAYSVTKTR